MKNALLLALALLASGILYYSFSVENAPKELSPALGLAPEIAAQAPPGLLAAQKADRERRLNRPAGLQGIAKSVDYFRQMRQDPETGTVDDNDVIEARAQAHAKLLQKSTLDLNWEELGPNNVGGRTRAMIIDRDNPQHLISGSVAGGVWLSDDGGNNWRQSPANATMESLSVSAITQAANGKIYVGTGEGFYHFFGNGSGGFPGEGIFVSEDGGETFTQTEAKPTNSNSNSGQWVAVNRLASSSEGNAVFAATSAGVYRSTDGFQTWDQMGQLSYGYDVHVAENGRVHMILGTRYYYSDDNGDSWTDNTGGADGLPILSGRGVIASAPGDGNFVYIAAESGSCLKGIYRSKDGGETWSLLTGGGSDFFQPLANGVQCQGRYDLAFAVAPWDNEKLFLGGISLWTWSESSSWYQIDGGSGTHAVHADKHDVIFDPVNIGTMYVIHDGGISKSYNGEDIYPDFYTINKNYNVTQYYGMAAGIDGQVLGGTQDNGTHLINFYEPTNSAQAAERVYGGDGGNANISHIKPNIMFASLPEGELIRSGNFGASFGSFLDCAVDFEPPSGNAPPVCGGDAKFDGAEQFVNPFELWEDLELYYNLYDAQNGDVFDPADDDYPFDYHNNKFIVTKNESFITEQPIEMFDSGDDIYLRADPETGQLIDRRIIRARYYTGTSDGAVWMNSTPLDLVDNDWVKIGQVSGTNQVITTFALSKDGTTAFAGTGRGKVIRIGDLNNYGPRLDDGGNIIGFGPNAEEILEGAEDFVVASGRNIRGIAIHPTSMQKLFVSATSYGANDYVFYSDNALTDMDFVSIQSDLPKMPVYDLGIARKSLQRYLIAGTEMGVWAYELTNDVTGGTWTNESGSLNNIQVLDVDVTTMGVQDPIAGLECDVVYIGTHGRGMFRSTDFIKNGCDEQVVLPDFNGVNQSTDLESAAGVPKLTVFPNPANAVTTVEFAVRKNTAASLKVYSADAKLVSQQNLGELSTGSYSEQLDLSELSGGQYFVVLQTEYGNSTKALVVAR